MRNRRALLPFSFDFETIVVVNIQVDLHSGRIAGNEVDDELEKLT